ncbi:Transcription elongation factor GreA [compost metagenome]
MNPSPFTGSRTQLVNQLVFWDEEKANFLNRYFPLNNKDRGMTDQLITKYSKALVPILSNLEETIHSQVLIGSRVIVRYVDDQTLETFTVVYPSQADPDHNLISFLSPLGMQLLLSNHEEIHSIQTPSGSYEIKVDQIQFVNKGEFNE